MAGRSVSILLALAILLASPVPLRRTTNDLPPCCKVHGCSMKPPSNACAFASCDQQGNQALTFGQPAAILASIAVPARERSRPVLAADLEEHRIGRPPAAIDHPPRRPV